VGLICCHRWHRLTAANRKGARSVALPCDDATK
jgi:hypothetical protein